jgi:hypothetical protein
MNWSATTTRTVDLGYEQLLVLEPPRPARVEVVYGGIWLTEAGRPDDVFAASGEQVAVRAHRRAVIEALGVARVQIWEQSRAGSAARLARAFSGAVRGAVAGAVRGARGGWSAALTATA